ncbi:hypothetical protein [Paenibacillus plantarum]|nr:hypothetical protein [Paenibacillus plantarum]
MEKNSQQQGERIGGIDDRPLELDPNDPNFVDDYIKKITERFGIKENDSK